MMPRTTPSLNRLIRRKLGLDCTTTKNCHSKRRHVVVALSGGVDSSVAAALLRQQLDDDTALTAIHMSNWNVYDDDSLTCTSQHDWNDALAVARHLDLRMIRQSFDRQYWNQVFEPYVLAMQTVGEMGNPDVSCNRFIKFGALREYCLQRFGNDSKLATGHYARLWHRHDNMPDCVAQALAVHSEQADWIPNWGSTTRTTLPPILLAALDRSKDQSYFLAGCTGDSLTNVLFPLGDYYKKSSQQHNQKTVRQLAQEWQLPTAHKRESMGICFVGKRRKGFQDFLQAYMPTPPTWIDFCDIDTGQVLGTTMGHAVLYTTGQGARLSGTRQKYFCVGSNAVAENESRQVVWVCAGTHHPALYADSLWIESVNWMAHECPRPLRIQGEWKTSCRIRHLQPLMNCTVRIHHDQQLQVIFDKPLRGITPGQQVVFYGLDGLVCFGGGPIVRRGPTYWEQGRELPTQMHPSGHNDLSLIENN